MGTLDSHKLQLEETEVKVPRGAIIKIGLSVLRLRKSDVKKQRENRRALRQKLEGLSDPTLLQRAAAND